jgi:TonB family protein
MPITEVPTSPKSPPEPPRNRKNTRYEEMEPHELLHVIDTLEDERSRARLREGIWISLIAHIIIFWFISYGQNYIFHHGIRVVDPSTVLRNREKEMTYLDLPPDALKHLKPKEAPPSDKDRQAQTKTPTIDKKTMEQLQAMRRAGPPVPVPPSEQPAAPAQPQSQQQQAQQQPKAAPSQPIPPARDGQLEAPAPAPTKPNFNTGPSTLGDAIRQAAPRGAHPGQVGGDMGAGAPSSHGGMNGAVDILSDTMGVDFGPYMSQVIYETKVAWYPIIPEAARPPLMKQGRVGIRFKIMKDGSVKEMILELPSGDVSLDRAAWGGITGASPYPQLPKNFKGPFLELRFWFLYNIQPNRE